MAELISNAIWFIASFAVGFALSSFFKRSSESVEEIHNEKLLFDKIREKEEETERSCKILEKESAERCAQRVKEAEDEAKDIIQAAQEEAKQLRSTSEAAIRNSFRDSVLIIRHLIHDKTKLMLEGDNEAVKSALQTISDAVISTGKTISWKGNAFSLVSSEAGETAVKPEDVSLLALSLLEPGLQKNLPTPEEIAGILEQPDENR